MVGAFELPAFLSYSELLRCLLEDLFEQLLAVREKGSRPILYIIFQCHLMKPKQLLERIPTMSKNCWSAYPNIKKKARSLCFSTRKESKKTYLSQRHRGHGEEKEKQNAKHERRKNYLTPALPV